jgi:hypothetical protein
LESRISAGESTLLRDAPVNERPVWGVMSQLMGTGTRMMPLGRATVLLVTFAASLVLTQAPPLHRRSAAMHFRSESAPRHDAR